MEFKDDLHVKVEENKTYVFSGAINAEVIYPIYKTRIITNDNYQYIEEALSIKDFVEFLHKHNKSLNEVPEDFYKIILERALDELYIRAYDFALENEEYQINQNWEMLKEDLRTRTDSEIHDLIEVYISKDINSIVKPSQIDFVSQSEKDELVKKMKTIFINIEDKILIEQEAKSKIKIAPNCPF